MSSDVALSVRGVSKAYTITHAHERHSTLAEAVLHRLRDPFRKAERETFWALKDVSFDVTKGEVLGIIGKNGAGKSTLLKIMSRITEPTSGEVDLYGRVGSLLEVGTGFHPELTGRENIYLNGQILGMRRREIDRHFDAIVDFAEVEKFIDTPVKRYSSGMYVRLAFAVAAHLDPEILVVDEVLAVGDATFQKKCIGKMADVAQQGRTVLFVSHNMHAVQALCHRIVWLHDGSVREDGLSAAIVSKYLKSSMSTRAEQFWPELEKAPGNERVKIRRATVSRTDGCDSEPITTRTPIDVTFEFWNRIPGAYLNLSAVLFNEEGIIVFNTIPIDELTWFGKPFPVGLFQSAFHIPADVLNDGTYLMQLLVVQDKSVVIYKDDEILTFEVLEGWEREGWFGKWAGTVRPRLAWRTQMIETQA